MLSKQEVLDNRQIFNESDTRAAATFKVLSDVNRYRIFRVLAQQPKLSVSNIAQILDISLPLASQHLEILARAKLLQKERRGKKIFPKLEHSNPFVQAIINTIKQASEPTE